MSVTRPRFLRAAATALALAGFASDAICGQPDLRLAPPNYNNRLPEPPRPIAPPPQRSINVTPTGPDSVRIDVQHGRRSVSVEASPNSVQGEYRTPVNLP